MAVEEVAVDAILRCVYYFGTILEMHAYGTCNADKRDCVSGIDAEEKAKDTEHKPLVYVKTAFEVELKLFFWSTRSATLPKASAVRIAVKYQVSRSMADQCDITVAQ